MWFTRSLRRGRIECRRAFPEKRPDFIIRICRFLRGDITEFESFRRGMTGCSQVYHLAGYAKNWAPSYETYFDITFTACTTFAGRPVSWASNASCGLPQCSHSVRPSRAKSATKPGGASLPNLHAVRTSKFAAEEEAAEVGREGLPLVIVNPGRVFGPGHFSEGNTLVAIDRPVRSGQNARAAQRRPQCGKLCVRR